MADSSEVKFDMDFVLTEAPLKEIQNQKEEEENSVNEKPIEEGEKSDAKGALQVPQGLRRLPSISSKASVRFNLSASQEIAERKVAQIEDAKERKRKKQSICKNLMVISIAFLLVFTAYQSIQNLQTSINSSQSLGLVSLTLIYISLVLTCMFVPSLCIKELGCKWTMVLCIVAYGTYMLANMYPRWWTMVPTSLLVGAAAAPLWSAKCAYLSSIAIDYAHLTHQPPDEVIGRFFGIFFITFQSSQVWGNWISSVVLAADDNTTLLELTRDDEMAFYSLNNPMYKYCGGANAACSIRLNYANITNLDPLPARTYYKLSGIYLCCIAAAAGLVTLFFDQLERDTEALKGKVWKKPQIEFDLMIATFEHLKQPHQIILIPLTIYSGMEQAFVAADFTKAYISCAWGVHMVGYVMIVYGAADSLCSVCFGRLVQLFGRIPLFMIGSALNICMMITLFEWRPAAHDSPVFFAIAASWGVADAVWQTQINSLYGVLFATSQEAAFSNYRLWESIGFIMAFSYSDALCARVKLFILLGFLLLGMSGYSIIELHMRYVSWQASVEQKKLEKQMSQAARRQSQVQTHLQKKRKKEQEESFFGQQMGNFLTSVHGAVMAQADRAREEVGKQVSDAVTETIQKTGSGARMARSKFTKASHEMGKQAAKAGTQMGRQAARARREMRKSVYRARNRLRRGGSQSEECSGDSSSFTSYGEPSHHSYNDDEENGTKTSHKISVPTIEIETFGESNPALAVQDETVTVDMAPVKT